MAKLISRGTAYHEVSLGSFHEAEVEHALSSQSTLIYPGFTFLIFRYLVVGDEESRRADFALVEREYRSWWVGEVELVHHDLDGHVLPQVRAFLTGQYGTDAANVMHEQDNTLDMARLAMLVETVQPRVLVVANKFSDVWSRAIHAEGAQLGIFEMFRSSHNEFIFRVNGFVPEPNGPRISECSLDPSVPRLLKVHSPAAFPFVHNGSLAIRYEGVVSDWSTRLIEGKVWLLPHGGNQLERDTLYTLREGEDSLLVLEKTRRGARK